MNAFFKATALAAATASLATAAPATAAPGYAPAHGSNFEAPGAQTYDHSRDRFQTPVGVRRCSPDQQHRGERGARQRDLRETTETNVLG